MLSELAGMLAQNLPAGALDFINGFVEKVMPYIDKPIFIIGACVLGYGILKKIGELIGVVVVLLVAYILLRYIGIDIAALV